MSRHRDRLGREPEASEGRGRGTRGNQPSLLASAVEQRNSAGGHRPGLAAWMSLSNNHTDRKSTGESVFDLHLQVRTAGGRCDAASQPWPS